MLKVRRFWAWKNYCGNRRYASRREAQNAKEALPLRNWKTYIIAKLFKKVGRRYEHTGEYIIYSVTRGNNVQ